MRFELGRLEVWLASAIDERYLSYNVEMLEVTGATCHTDRVRPAARLNKKKK
jgi:hypothetical protein